MSYRIHRMTGRCESYGGIRYHAVASNNFNGWSQAICGASPGARGNGWSTCPGDKVTCLRCALALAWMDGPHQDRMSPETVGKKSTGADESGSKQGV
jgi:hypothetical protein